MKYFLFVFLFGMPFFAFSQFSLDSITILPTQLQETSGLIFFNGKLITHTDSFGENALYEIDTITGQILRTVYIENTTNKDWEDIAQDDDYIYIGDFGNNQGNRTDLMIYQLSKIEYLSNDTVQVDTIQFAYTDQVDFTSTSQQTNFDAEALLSFQDNLYVFTKNWGNLYTKVYQIPKIIGNHTVSVLDSFFVDGLITGVDYNLDRNTVLMTGYYLPNAFIWEFKDFSNNDFFGGQNTRYDISPVGSIQIEAICASNKDKYFISSEKFITSSPVLHSIIFSAIIDTVNNDTSIIESIVELNDYGIRALTQ